MGLGQVLGSATAGLRVTEQALNVVSRNVANSDTAGYTRKRTENTAVLAAGDAVSVRAGVAQRDLDRLLQAELREARSAQSKASTLNDFLQQVDALLGAPGGVNGLDTAYNEFTAALTELVATPDSTVARTQVIAKGEDVAGQLNRLSDGIQRLRIQAEQSIASETVEINKTLQNIEALSVEIIQFQASGDVPGDLLDARDIEIDKLSQYFDIQVIEANTGQISIFTQSGTSLFDGKAATVAFDERSAITPQSLYSEIPSQRDVGTIQLTNGNGGEIDLLQVGVLREGSIAAYAEIRDDILVEAQAQLDEVASQLSLALSTVERTPSEVLVGDAEGLSIDLAGIQPGDTITIDYTENGVSNILTIVRVDDATQLPLDDNFTNNPNDTVVGVSFALGTGAAIGQINSLLGNGLSASLTGPSTLQIIDDGAAGTTNVDGLSTRITATALSDEGLAIPFFTDGGSSGDIYSRSLEAGDQKFGYSARIQVNRALIEDPAKLIDYQTSPATLDGDSTRPLDLEERLTQGLASFSPDTSIGSATAPFEGTLGQFIQRVTDFQGTQAANASRENDSKTLIADSLETRFTEETGVNIDEELARLLVLQNTYSANARVLSAVDELFDRILAI